MLAPRYGDVVDGWVAAARRQVDPGTGLLPHQVDPRVVSTRASSQSVIQRFLPEIDPGWADAQYRRFRRDFVVTRLGQPGVRESPAGRGGGGDVDSGPLVLGVSASATVVTIGAARVHGDRALAGPLTGLGEAVGMPVRSWSGKAYLFGLLPVGDAFLAWSAAARPAPGLPDHGSDGFPTVVPPWWRWPWHALTLLALALLWSPLWVPALMRHRRRPDVAPSPDAG